MSNKEKLLASAQKFLAKGQVPRAIKDYEKIVEIDPKDVRSRQKLAELYSRARMTPQAIDAFEWVAKYYAENGFHLKAIAVYKQMQRLDPGRHGIYLRLAQLNEKQGLIGNALAEYRTLVGHFEKIGKIPEAVNVLQKMKELEPENLNIRVKIIEVHLHAGSREKALDEFGEVVALLEPKRDYIRLQKIHEFFLPHFPGEPRMRTGLARVLIRKGEPARGIGLLNEVLGDFPEDEEALRLLAEGYRADGQHPRERQVLEQLLRSRPEDLELRGAFLLARLDGGESGQALAELEEWKDLFIEGNRIAALKGLYERLRLEMPAEERVIRALQSIYEMTGEGDKFFDMISAAPGGDPEAPAAEPERAEEAFAGLIPGRGAEEAEAPGAPEGADEADAADEGAEEIPLEFLEGIEPLLPTDIAAAGASVEPPGAEPEVELELEFDLDGLEELRIEPPAPTRGMEETGPPAEPEPVRADADFGFFDLRAAVLDEGEGVVAEVLSLPGAPAEGLFPPPKKGIKTDVDVEDPESHYNLGIAYKEMGLVDDAVNEFDKAMGDPSLMVACLTLKGICLAEKGALPGAEEAFRTALAHPGLDGGERMGLHYELGLLYEGWDRSQEALANFEEVASIDPFFRDAGEKVRILRRKLGQEENREEDSPRRKDRIFYV